MTGVRVRVLVNLALLGLAFGLAAVIWLDPWRQQPPAAEKLSAIDPSTVNRLRIERPKRAPIALERTGSSWHMTSPISLPANPYRVAALLRIASAPVHDAFRAEGNDLRQFGLEPPKVKLLLNQHEFRFGDAEPLHGFRYVHYGPDVHLVTDTFFHHLLATAPAFVDPVPIGSDERAESVSLKQATVRLENGRWRVDSADLGLSSDAAERLASAWSSARATSVKAFEPGLDWREEVRVHLVGQPEPLRFVVARLQHQLVLGRPDRQVQYHFAKQAGLALVTLGE